MEPLKNAYNHSFFDSFLNAFKEIHPNTKDEQFLKLIFSTEWEQYELKSRMHHITKTLHFFLAPDFKTAVKEIKQLIAVLQKHNIPGGFEYLFLPDYIEMYGQDYLVESIASFETITPYVSCEFAIRPFIIAHTNYVIAKMTEWSFHPNKHLRRLASEGCRPRLPWAMALPYLKKDPTKIISILENLVNDSELYVRKSVANNLNDISKDNKQVLIDFTEKHFGETEHTDWILKHANRNLLKQAEPTIMAVFGFGNTAQIDVQNFKLSHTLIKLGDDLHFSFDIINNAKTQTLIRLEYAVYYLKNNGTLSKKIFQISQKEFAPYSITKIRKKQHFKLISTRKYYYGKHQISIIANGKEFDFSNFKLTY
ncbi:3-methyladenine DNA glycosylase AlkC [Wenyingzhuangia heitensis]|uniref:3-methyladenine DNA glycosylase AlkC n=1 Tax=Wenyingzhuangia heitensis TaxID=1487859 RepID=A0ABX0U8M3_9FLAO|nr:DNA alkylation repair protein [Wenyingzhuangia heitensis]NIJ44694.1 3-methyladenine DNA glycosylase AlkC [Wenyingzhuangia heitensis]